MSTTADQQTGEAVLDTVVERFGLKSLVEACLLVEEGVAQIKDIDMGMMMGAGIIPGPFAAADIKEFTKMDEQTGREMVETAHKLMRGMETSRTVTIAAVNSIAFGGGCELAMACDFRIAAESATFGQPEINLGIIPGFGGTQRLPRLVGEAKALEMNLVGEPIDAWEAERLGLANEVVPDHELFDTALAWARYMAEPAPIAIEQIKSVPAMGELGEGL